MALEKNIELENGIILNYHRIVNLSKITNIKNIIEVSSYVSEQQREKEKQYQELQRKNASEEELTKEEREELEKGINVLTEVKYVEINYDKDMTIEEAYTYLKTLDKYKNSKDVLEESDNNG